jgi:DNA-binding NarL/FixJ family response regulator
MSFKQRHLVTGRSWRVVIADDQADIRSAFRLIVDSQPDMQVVGEAANGAAALDTVRHVAPDVALMDIRMPGMDGLEVTRRLTAETRTAPVKVIVVTTFDLDEYIATALSLGACGFLLKRSGPALLTEAIRAATNGDMLVSPQVTRRVLHHTNGRPPGVSACEPSALSRREVEIAELVAQGRTNGEIAEVLVISAGTVKTHVANIAAKLDVRNRVGIAAWAWEQRITRPSQHH